MPESKREDRGAAAAEADSNRIVLEQAALTMNRIQDLLQLIPAPTR